MKILKINEMENIIGGITPKDCINLGAYFAGFLLIGELEIAAGVFIGATSAGCFD